MAFEGKKNTLYKSLISFSFEEYGINVGVEAISYGNDLPEINFQMALLLVKDSNCTKSLLNTCNDLPV